MEATLWCVARSTGFREAILVAANIADDADTVAAIAGQLAGAIWGAASVAQFVTAAYSCVEPGESLTFMIASVRAS